jgi:hypothetical protein
MITIPVSAHALVGAGLPFLTMRIMLDLETLGTRPGSIITAIGAVCFQQHDDPAQRIAHSFYQRIDPIDAQRHGFTIDADTVLWWMQQNQAPREELTDPRGSVRLPIIEALTAFAEWMKNSRDTELWGNDPSFDNALLAEAYHQLHLPVPWKHRANRCYRTMRALIAKDIVTSIEPKIAHHAQHDAEAQALTLLAIERHLQKPVSPAIKLN